MTRINHGLTQFLGERQAHQDPDRRLWRCPACGGLNVWNWEDADRLAERGMTVKVAHGSCFDNVCGHCGADLVLADSPIMADCYTHAAD